MTVGMLVCGFWRLTSPPPLSRKPQRLACPQLHHRPGYVWVIIIRAMFTFPCTELMHIRNSLPDAVVVQRVDERLSALGNTIACNDYVALIHPDIDRVCTHVCGRRPNHHTQLVHIGNRGNHCGCVGCRGVSADGGA